MSLLFSFLSQRIIFLIKNPKYTSSVGDFNAELVCWNICGPQNSERRFTIGEFDTIKLCRLSGNSEKINPIRDLTMQVKHLDFFSFLGRSNQNGWQ